MPISGFRRILAAAIALGAALGGPIPRGLAVEPVREFLHGLRERGLHDAALLYLEQAETCQLVPDDVRRTLPYERGVTLLELARQSEDPEIKAKWLTEAHAQLEAFVGAHADDSLASTARNQLADALLQRGQALALQAEQPSRASDRNALLAKAHNLFQQVRRQSEENATAFTEQLKTLPKFLDPKTESAAMERRDGLRGSLLNAKLTVATATYEGGKTFPAGSQQFQTQLGEAAGLYGDMYEKYGKPESGRLLAGLYARLREGRCYHDLGQMEKATACAEDLIIQQANEPAFRTLVAKAVKLRGDCLMSQGKYDPVIRDGTEWLAKARGAESQDADWLAVRYQIASAHLRKAEDAKGPDNEQRRHLQEAQGLAREVVRYGGPHQKQARGILLQTGFTEKVAEPATFAAALESAQAALDRMQTGKVGLELARKNNPASVGDLTRQYEEGRDAAAKYLRLAIQLAEAKTPVDDINRVRYYLCHLNWELGQYYDAAILGQFLAHRYPDSAGARQGARIALAAYQKVYAEPGNVAPDFEAAKLLQLATLIAQQWPDQPDVDDAYALLAGFAIDRGQWAEALDFIGKISPDRRARPEIKMGLALWSQHLRQARLEAKDRPSQAELDKLKNDARARLQEGMDRGKGSGDVDETLATAALSLVQIHLDSNQYDKAIALLEDGQIGPLTLLAAGHPAAGRAGFAEEACKAALRAYVSAQPPLGEKARQVMDMLDQLAGKEANAGERLTRIYISLGHQLQEQLEQLRASGKEQELDHVTRTFESLLDRMVKQETGGDWVGRNWLARTYASLGAAMEKDGRLSPPGKLYVEKAVATYDAILERAEETPAFAPNDDAVLGVMMRKAECLRQLHRFKEAIQLLAALLTKKPNMLDAQVAAAVTYQQRGDVEDPRWYLFAWQGGQKDRKTSKNRIWGWAGIAHAVVRYDRYRDVFHEARYNMAMCRCSYARKQSGDERQKYLRFAKNDIRYTVELYPDLGGETWRPKYDSLLRDIQRQLGEDPVGLAAFDKKSPAVKTTTTG